MESKQLRIPVIQISSLLQFSRSDMSNSLWPMDHCTPGSPIYHQLPEVAQTHVHWVGDVIQPSHPVVPFSSCLHSFLASGSFPNSQFFASDGQSIGQSISPSNEYSGLISFRKFSLWYLSPNLPRICFFSLPHWNRLHKGRDSLLYPHS